MTKENWIKWLQVRIPILKEKHNEFWLGQALDGYKDDEQSRQAAVSGSLPQSECEHDWQFTPSSRYVLKMCRKCRVEVDRQ